MLGKVLATAAATIMFAHSAASAEALQLAPTAGEGWVLDYGDDRCRLMRNFGEGDQRTLALFEQFVPSPAFNLTIAGPGVARQARAGRVDLQFGPLEPAPITVEVPRADLDTVGPALLFGPMLFGRVARR